jgi:hypothetical protein
MSGGPRRVLLSRTSELMRLPQDVVDMAYFGARDEAPADVCRRVVPKTLLSADRHAFFLRAVGKHALANQLEESIDRLHRT